MNRMLLVLFVAMALVFTSCGGGGGGGGSTPPPPVITLTIGQTLFPYGVIGQPYPGGQLTASGGTAPYTWSASSVPTGMTFSSGGKLTGATPGTIELGYAMVITVNDASGHSGTSTVALNTYLPLSASIPAKELRSGVASQGTLVILMNQSNLSATAKLVSGSLPPGLVLGTTLSQGPNPTLPITGTPTQSGIFPFTVEVADSLSPPRVSQVPLKMFIDVHELFWAMSTTLNPGKRTEVYSTYFSTIGGTAPITCALVPESGSLPPGMALGTDCILAGTPTQIGTFNFTVRATDSGTPQQAIDKAFSLNIAEPLKIADLPDATTGEIYTTSLQITGGVPPYTVSSVGFFSCCFVVEKHDLTLHGVPYDPGVQFVDITVTDSAGQSIRPLTRLNVNEGPFRLGTDNLPRLKAGQFYSGSVSIVSGKRPVTWAIESGALPPDLGFNSNFAQGINLFGFPSTAGTYPVTFKVTDSSTPPQVLHIPLSLQVYAKLPRNDSVAQADSFAADVPYHQSVADRSISPYADPPDLANPDQDYYHFTAFAGETIQANVTQYAVIDPAIEIVDVNGRQFTTCRNPGDDTPDANGVVDLTPLAFDDACANDDIIPGVNINSQLQFRVPGASGTVVDFYLHVLDFRGDARPDMQYRVVVTHQPGAID